MAAIFVVSLFSFIGYRTLSTHAMSNENATPVILVHGYSGSSSGCQGINLATYWNKVKIELADNAYLPASKIVPVSYYRCDTNGVDITGYGQGVSYPSTVTKGNVKARAGYSNDDSITAVSRSYAWFVYNEYTQKGQPVNSIGHSMGGLIIREALRRVQAHDPTFPPALDIQKVLTVSTPHNGWGSQCKSNTQCTELSDGSQFLKDLQANPSPQGKNGTAWWAMGLAGVGTGQKFATSACDFIPTASATAVGGTALVYDHPCYRHNGYLTDDSQKLDATGTPSIAGRHSLKVMVDIMK